MGSSVETSELMATTSSSFLLTWLCAEDSGVLDAAPDELELFPEHPDSAVSAITAASDTDRIRLQIVFICFPPFIL